MRHTLKLLKISITLVCCLASSTIAGSVEQVQRMLNQLGYSAGPVDGAYGRKTKSALDNFYSDNEMVFDGDLSKNEAIDLKKSIISKIHQNFGNQKVKGSVTTFGNYISPENKIDTPRGFHYYLPSDLFTKKLQSERSQVFWANHFAWGNFSGNKRPELVVSWELHQTCRGKFKDSGHGTWYCEDMDQESSAQAFPFAVFGIEKSRRVNLADKFIGQTRVMPYNCNRQLVADFNEDDLDDIYCPSTVQGKKGGKFWFGGPDLVYISDGKGRWIRTAEAGEMVDKKYGTYNGFSHGSTAADIDNDGDIDVITPHIKWENTKGGGKIYCHVNDGKGNFNVRHCADQFAFSVTTGDYDGDGNVDLMASGGWHQSPAYAHSNSKKHQQTPILFGDGKGNFGKKRKWKYLEAAYDIYGSNFLFTSLIGPVSWDFDGDGDVDIAGTSIGPLYVGGTHTIWENDGKGNFTVADQVPLVPSPKKFSNRTIFKQEVKMETNQWNSYCGRSVLIDLNEDGLMDVICDNVPQDRHNGWFFLNEGGLYFRKISPFEAWKNGWVQYYTSVNGAPEQEFSGYSDPDFFQTHWVYKADYN